MIESFSANLYVFIDGIRSRWIWSFVMIEVLIYSAIKNNEFVIHPLLALFLGVFVILSEVFILLKAKRFTPILNLYCQESHIEAYIALASWKAKHALAIIFILIDFITIRMYMLNIPSSCRFSVFFFMIFCLYMIMGTFYNKFHNNARKFLFFKIKEEIANILKGKHD